MVDDQLIEGLRILARIIARERLLESNGEQHREDLGGVAIVLTTGEFGADRKAQEVDTVSASDHVGELNDA